MINKLLVQKFLETKTFGDLIKEHGVYASLSKSGRKFSLNYDQIEAKETDPLAQECRGLILSSTDGNPIYCEITADGKRHYENVGPGETTILAYPMKRFFNYGQGCAAEINWSDPNLAVLEKLDGTLCIVYFDKFTEKWCVATRSVPEADLLMDNGLFTFRTLFEKAVEDTTELTFNALTELLSKSHTYCFELTTPYNRIVVAYPNNGITLLAVRDLTTGKEVDFSHDVVQYLNCVVPFVQAYTPTSVSEIVDWVSSLNPMEHEGVVVRDGQFNRIKVKNAAYVAYNKVRDQLATSERNIVELILQEKDDDVIPMLPEEIVKNLQKIKIGMQAAIKKYDEAYLAAKAQADATNPGDKKTFAILVTKDKSMWNAPFFQIFDGKASGMKDFILKNRKDGSWGDSFLDRILDLAKRS
jgi:T4 RnlA family RNA ligase